MRKMRKWLMLAMVLLVIPALASTDNSGPKIEKFELFLTGPRTAMLNFNFTGVKEGLPGAEFVIAYEVERNGVILQSGQASGLKFAPDPRATIKISTGEESGKVKAILPVEETIKVGDKIRYLIYLIDAQGRKSNTVEFTFILKEVKIL